MYWASCPSAQSNMTVTVNFASTQALYILPVVFTGEVSTSLGATTTASPASGSTLTATVTPQAAGSYVFGVFCNGFSTASPTVPSGQTITVNGTSTFLSEATHGTSFWVQYQTATTTGSSVTINDTAPTGGGGIVLAEILAAVTTSRYLLGVPHRRGPLQARMRGFGVSVPPISPVLPTNPGWAPPIISPNSTYF
ncbi:MAG: hypothetical protein JO246_07140 [Frankiaceae bacterium]|nr:hypothetical protein [Frankiaceae bacterium]